MGLLTNLIKSAARWGVAKKTSDGGLVKTGLGYLVTRVATRSVPGALMVGGAYLGRHLWNRRKARKTAAGAAATSDKDALARAEKDARIDEKANHAPSQIGKIGSE